SLESALIVRSRLLRAFEAAEAEPDPERRVAWLTFVVVGGGPTGVEMAGQIAELARDTLRRDFRAIDPRTGRILLVEAADRVLTTFPPSLSATAERSLRRLGATVLTAHTGPRAPGDGATPDPGALPGLAPVAMQQGRCAARVVQPRLRARKAPPSRYRDKGTLATLGRAAAVADIKGLRLSGFLAWSAWLLVHLWYLVGFQNRILVFIRWSFSFVTHGRGARLITESAAEIDGRGPHRSQ